jgi:hypothetical protein
VEHCLAQKNKQLGVQERESKMTEIVVEFMGLQERFDIESKTSAAEFIQLTRKRFAIDVRKKKKKKKKKPPPV